MRSSARLLVCSCFVGLIASSARANVLWRGDFQTGDLTQWTSKEVVASDLLTVVTNPVPTGSKYALRVLVQQGDVIFGGTRSEVDYETDRPKDGDERYYHWKTMWPSDYKSANYWQLFTQWHQYNTGTSPPLAFLVNGEQIMLGDSSDHYYWTGPLERGSWHDFIVHVTWSTSSSVGGVEIWYDGQHVLPFTHGATLPAGDTVYVKQGLYRKDLITWDQTIYHAGMTVATTYADVADTTAPPTTGTGVAAGSGGDTSPGTGSGTSTTGGTTSGTGTTTTTSGTTSSSGAGGQTLGGTSATTTAHSGCNAAGMPWAASAVIAAAFLLRRRRAHN